MTSPSTSAGGSADFIRFPKLPKELRLKIWKRSLPDPRTVELVYRPSEPKEGDFLMQGYFSSSSPIPITLSICQESRSEALAEYELSFPTSSSGPKVYFNPSIDTLVLSWLGGLDTRFFPIIKWDCFDKVQHVCFTSWNLEHVLKNLENDQVDVYPSIKTITVALDIDSVDMATGQLSIEKADFTIEEEALCAAKIEDFTRNFLVRHPNQKIPTVMVRSIKRR